jgi:hypothetical protein
VRRLALAAAACLVVAVVAFVELHPGPEPPPRRFCVVAAHGGRYELDLAQAELASTIAAIGKRRGLPNHAATIALATALQESQLRNLPNGDRDSVGVFQQRPSQGWGTVQQLRDPRYATNRFYAALERVPHWATLPVTEAAQRVQRSALPNGYAPYESRSRTLASALTGEVPAAITCALAPSPPVNTIEESALRAAMASELPRSSLRASASVDMGWTAAAWLVAHAASSGVSTVRYADRTWNRAGNAWTPTPPVAQVSFTLAH